MISKNEGRGLADDLYTQVKHRVRALEPHARLTSERKLARQCGASHSTVRRVMNRLQDEGLIYKVHGGGCYVAEPATDSQALQTLVYVDTEIGSVSHPFFARRLAGILEACEACGFRLQIVRYSEAKTDGENSPLVQELERQEVAGVIVPWMRMQILSRLRAANPALQVVTTATRFPPPGTAAVFPDYGSFGQQVARWAQEAGEPAMTVLYSQLDSLAGAQALARDGGDEAAFSVTGIPAPLTEDPAAAAELAAQVVAAGATVLAADDSLTTRQVMAALERDHPDFAARCRWLSQANVGDTSLPPSVLRLEMDGYPFGRQLVESLHQLLRRGTTEPLVTLIGPVMRAPEAAGR